MLCVLVFGDWKKEEAENSDNLHKEARGKKILQGQSWCLQLVRVGSGESSWGCLEEERKQLSVEAAESPGAQQCKGHHGYLTNPCPISPCLALKTSHCSSGAFTSPFSLSVKCAIRARNLPKALPCFSHPSVIITLQSCHFCILISFKSVPVFPSSLLCLCSDLDHRAATNGSST